MTVPPYVWYASSSQADGTLVNLYRIDVRTGERALEDSQHNKSRVDQAWIVQDSGRPRISTKPAPETKVSRILPPSALWPPPLSPYEAAAFTHTPPTGTLMPWSDECSMAAAASGRRSSAGAHNYCISISMSFEALFHLSTHR